MRNLKIGKPLPGEHKEPFRKILVYCHVFLRNIAIHAICRHFLKNCFYRSGGNRSTDRFWGVYTEIPLYSLTKRPVLSDTRASTLRQKGRYSPTDVSVLSNEMVGIINAFCGGNLTAKCHN